MATESAPLLRKPRSPLRPFLVTVVAGLGVMAAAAVFGKRPPGSGRAAYLEVQQAGAGLVDGLAEDLEADADAKVTVFYDASVDDLFVYGVTALLAFGVDAPFSFEAYETMDGLLKRRPAAGDVVLAPLLTGLETERSLGCAFLFSEDPLLLNEDFMALLAYDRPLQWLLTLHAAGVLWSAEALLHVGCCATSAVVVRWCAPRNFGRATSAAQIRPRNSARAIRPRAIRPRNSRHRRTTPRASAGTSRRSIAPRRSAAAAPSPRSAAPPASACGTAAARWCSARF